MKKEILFAVIAGALFGLVIAFGIWKANSSMKLDEEISQESSNASDETVKTEEGQFGITIASPETHDVLIISPVTITGITKKNSWLVISAEEEDYIVKTDPNGSFEQDVELIAGVNEVIITVIDDEGNSSKETLILVYSTEFDKVDTEQDEEIEEVE